MSSKNLPPYKAIREIKREVRELGSADLEITAPVGATLEEASDMMCLDWYLPVCEEIELREDPDTDDVIVIVSKVTIEINEILLSEVDEALYISMKRLKKMKCTFRVY